jgi:hypothetical protein
MGFHNASGEPIEVLWLDFEGTSVPYLRLEPDKQSEISTYLAHPWIINDKDGNCLCGVLPDEIPRVQHVSVTSGGCSLAVSSDVFYVPTDQYDRRKMEGYDVLISPTFSGKPDTLDALLEELSEQLRRMNAALPSKARQRLSSVKIWLEAGGASGRARYHASADWLIHSGQNPDKAKGVEFSSDLVAVSGEQSWLVLHEFAHAYHDIVLGFEYEPAIDAFEAAQKAGLYGRVAHISGDMEDAYAATDVMEFFAENSEAFFGRNDYFPFNRTQLDKYDPKSARMLEAAWNR